MAVLMRSHSPSRLPSIAVALLSVLAVAGCAAYQGPRIDPTGERLFVWPGDPQPIAAAPTTFAPPPPGAVVAAPPPGAVVVAPPPAPVVAVQPQPRVVPSSPFGNVVAPPVYSDPPGTVATTPFVGPANAVPPPPPVVGPIASLPAPPAPLAGPALPPPPPVGPPIMAPPTPVAPAGVEHVVVRPNGIIAPVGTEMILKGYILTAEGFMLPNQRMDWAIACNGVGQFAEMGFRDRGQFFGWWESPRRIDDRNATTNTALIPITLNTSTPNPCDDVPIERGESWVTVTSAQEGISVVTATAPGLCQFNQASSTIYWIDAQWIVPPPVCVEAGRPHTITTTVMRRSDGAPLAGWIVRYDVGNNAALGYEGGSATDVTTDAAGRASVEVSPKGPGAGVANVTVTIIRPANVGPASMPQLCLGRNATTVSWGAAPAAVPVPIVPGAPGPPPASPPPLGPPPTTMPPPSLPPTSNPPPTSPPPSTTPDPYRAPTAADTGKPQLEVTMRLAGSEQVSVGEYAAFDLTVTNRGTGPARHIVVSDRYDRGLKHPSAASNERPVEYRGLRDLAPGESDSVRLTFQVIDVGKQCHEATVTADGADPVIQSACVTARQAVLEVTVDVPRTRTVGQIAEAKAVLKNIGDVTATNVDLVIQADPALVPTMAEPGSEPLPGGGIRLRIPQLAANERREIRMNAECRAASNRACVRALVTADGGVSTGSEDCVEILPADAGAALGGAAPAQGPDLRLTINVGRNPARVNDMQLITVTVANAGQQTERQVATRIILPPELIPDPAQIQPRSEATVTGNEVRFAPIAEFPAGQQKQYIIPVKPARTGRVQVQGQIALGQTLSTPINSEWIDIQSGS